MLSITRWVPVVCLIVGLPAVASAQFDQGQAPPPNTGLLQQERQQDEQRMSENAVAKVNGDVITQQELEASVQAQLQGQQVEPQQLQQLHNLALEGLIESRLVEQYVLEEGPDVAEREVQSHVDNLKQQLHEQQVGFEEFLASRGYTEKALKQRIEGSLAWQKHQQQQVNEDRVRAFYDQNRDQFHGMEFEQVRPQVIQAVTHSLWSDIVQTMKPGAEIEVAEGLRPQPLPPAQEQQPPLPPR